MENMDGIYAEVHSEIEKLLAENKHQLEHEINVLGDEEKSKAKITITFTKFSTAVYVEADMAIPQAAIKTSVSQLVQLHPVLFPADKNNVDIHLQTGDGETGEN